MNVEQILSDELRSVATSIEAPPPPVAGLVRDAERARTRTLRTRLAGTVLVAAAVVGAIVIGTQVGRPSTAPPPTNPSPSYYAPGVPYVLEGVLHIDHEPQPGWWVTAETIGEYTVAVRDTGHLATAVVLHDGREVFSAPHVVSGPVMSPHGTSIAWLELPGGEPGGPPYLVVRDLPANRTLGRLELDGPRGSDVPEPSIEAVDDDGTAYYHEPRTSRTRAWTPGAEPVDGQPPAGSRTPEGFPEDAEGVQLSPDHLWGAWLTGTDHTRQLLAVQKPGEPESLFTIALPTGPRANWVNWQSLTEVFAMARDETADTKERIYACDTVKRRCQDVTTSVIR